jgi:hypothetical protein
MADIKLTHVLIAAPRAAGDLVGGHVDMAIDVSIGVRTDPQRFAAHDCSHRRGALVIFPMCRPSRNRACRATPP